MPELEVACCDSYAKLSKAIEAFAPETQFHIGFESAPYPNDAIFGNADLPGLPSVA